MKLEAMLHIPISNYAYPLSETTLVIRLRTAKHDVEKCSLYYGDRVCEEDPIHVSEVVMEKLATDQLFDYYEARIEECYPRVCYYFSVHCGVETYYYSGDGFSKSRKLNRTQYFQFPYLRREDLLEIPDWAEEAIIYHIFPDSFASDKEYLRKESSIVKASQGSTVKNRLGGTLLGIVKNLDYIEDLGINCIYLNPIFLAESYHKYDTIDYYQIDPCMGVKEDLILLVKECHKREIKVILDGVFNHCGWKFFAFEDVLLKGEDSSYKDWFYQLEFPIDYSKKPNYETFAYVKEMPKLNTGNDEVVNYFCKVGQYWIKEADIDGWRLDVANEVNHDFWRAFRKAVREVKKDAFLIAEIWEDSSVWLCGDQFDSSMNYGFSYVCREFFADRSIDEVTFDEKVQSMLMRYSSPITRVQMNLLDSHDVPRFLTYCGDDSKRLRLAIFYMLTCVGIPSIFYGDEKLIDGTTEYEYRRAMDWEQGKEGEEKKQKDIKDTVEYVKKWINVRKKYKAFSHGGYQTVVADQEKAVYAFLRYTEEEEVLVIIHNAPQRGEFVVPDKYLGKLYDIESGERISEKVIPLDAMSGTVVRVAHV